MPPTIILPLVGFRPFRNSGRWIDDFSGRFQIDPRRSPFAVEAKVDHDTREPGPELRQRLPTWRVRPDAQECFLRNVLGFCGVPEDTPGKPEHGWQMAPRKQLECPFVSTGDPRHERLVAVIHRKEVATIGIAGPFQFSAYSKNGRGG